jgi:rhodanese-related sulfurtransferase
MVASGAPAVAGAAAHQGPLLLHCSKGPKALVALSYLAPLLPKGEEVYVVDGGVTAWEDNNLPIEMV